MSFPSIDLILQERAEQCDKHGFDAAHDDQLTHDELSEAAIALLTEDPERWPAKLDQRLFFNASEKGEAERRVVAAALLAADIDRILRERARTTPLPRLTVGGNARVRHDVYDRCMAAGIDAARCEHLIALRGMSGTVISIDEKLGLCVLMPLGMSGTETLPTNALIPTETTNTAIA